MGFFVLKMTTEELNTAIKEKYESFILIAQVEEFGTTDLYVGAYTSGIHSLLKDGFEQFPILKSIAKDILLEDEK